MTRILQKWPIEVYVLIILPILTVAGFVLLGHSSSIFLGRYLNTMLYYFLFGGSFLFIALIFINLYFGAKILSLLGHRFFLKEFDGAETKRRLIKVIKNHLSFLAVLFFGTFLSGALVSNLSNSGQVLRIATVSNKLMEMDFSIFGNYPLFSFSQISVFWSKIFVNSYSLLSIILPVFFLAVICFKKELARKFILFFFVSQIISFPIWYALPALSPYNLYVENITGAKLPEKISAAAKNFQPDEELADFLKEVKDYRVQANSYLDLTTMPSMHAGWGAGVLYYGAKLWPPLLLLLAPWSIFPMVGAVYTGEHYAVDIFAGLAVAILAIWAVKALLILEKKYYRGGEPLGMIDSIQEDCRHFSSFLREIF